MAFAAAEGATGRLHVSNEIRRGGNLDGQLVLHVLRIEGYLEAIRAIGVFDADGMAVRATSIIGHVEVLQLDAPVGVQDGLEGAGFPVAVREVRDRLVLDDEAVVGFIIVVVDGAAPALAVAWVKVIPVEGDQVVRIVRVRDLIVRQVGGVAAKGQVAIRRDGDVRLGFAVKLELKRKGNRRAVIVAKRHRGAFAGDVDPAKGWTAGLVAVNPLVAIGIRAAGAQPDGVAHARQVVVPFRVSGVHAYGRDVIRWDAGLAQQVLGGEARESEFQRAARGPIVGNRDGLFRSLVGLQRLRQLGGREGEQRGHFGRDAGRVGQRRIAVVIRRPHGEPVLRCEVEAGDGE